MIISASRRTDIPSTHCKWFLEKLKDKYVLVRNPFNKNKFYKVDLSKENVDIIVFWSKKLLKILRILNGSSGYMFIP